MKVPSWQFVRFGQVDISDMLNGNGRHESSEVNGQTALEVGTTQWSINLGSLSIKRRLQAEINPLPEVVGKIVQEADLFLTKGRLTHLI